MTPAQLQEVAKAAGEEIKDMSLLPDSCEFLLVVIHKDMGDAVYVSSLSEVHVLNGMRKILTERTKH